MPQQGDGKNRGARRVGALIRERRVGALTRERRVGALIRERRIGAEAFRRGTGNLPTRLCRTRHRVAAAQREREHPRTRRREHEPARGGQVEGRCPTASSAASPPKGFENHRGQRRAGHRFGPGAQQRQRIGRLHQHQPRRIKPQIGKPQPIGPVLPGGAILAQPQQRAGPTAAQRQQQRKGSDTGGIPLPLRVEFVERGHCQAAAKPRINRIEPQRETPVAPRSRWQARARKGWQQSGATRHVHYMF